MRRETVSAGAFLDEDGDTVGNLMEGYVVCDPKALARRRAFRFQSLRQPDLDDGLAGHTDAFRFVIE